MSEIILSRLTLQLDRLLIGHILVLQKYKANLPIIKHMTLLVDKCALFVQDMKALSQHDLSLGH